MKYASTDISDEQNKTAKRLKENKKLPKMKNQHFNIKNVDQKSSVSNNKIKALKNPKYGFKKDNNNSQSLKSNKETGNKQDKFLNVATKKQNLNKPSSGFTDENKRWLKLAKDKKVSLENSDDNDSTFEEDDEIDDDDDVEMNSEDDEEQSQGEDEDEEDEEEEDENDDEDESFEDDNLDNSATVPPKNILQKDKKKNIQAKVGYITLFLFSFSFIGKWATN